MGKKIENVYQPAILVEDEVALKKVIARWNKGELLQEWDEEALQSLILTGENALGDYIIGAKTTIDKDEARSLVYMIGIANWLAGVIRGKENR